MPLPHRVLSAPQPDAWAPVSWADSVRVHVNAPIYPGYSEGGFRADLAEDGGMCACPMCSGASPSEPQFFQQPQSGVAGNGLPIFSWDQAATQITRQSGGWGAGAVVTYGFRANEPAVMPGVGGFVQFNPTQIALAIETLALWSEVANITFLRVDDGSGYTNNATMLFSNYTTGAEGASAFAYYPGGSDNAGDVWINFSLDTNNSNLIEGAFGPHTMAHEIGHAIGLAHPANYDSLSGTDPVYPDSAVYWQDSRMYTVMSYFGSAGPGGSLGAFASGPQLHDIAAAQLLYGANMTTRTGDTVYGFNSNTGHAHFSITADEQTPVFAIWDAGGNDTLDLSGYSTTVEIDLRAEAFSSAGPGTNPAVNNGRAYGNISIARGAVIENGIGGAGDDILIGNSAINTLTGNAGADAFTGFGGNDTLNGGAGADVSIYSIASTSASWTRNPNGTWTVAVGADGTDTLSSVEYLNFTDRSVFLDRPGSNFSTDGVSDFFLRNTSTGGMVMWFNGANTNAASLGSLSTAWANEGFGDFNGDGRDDILWRNSTTGDIAAWFMNNQAISGSAGFGLGVSWNVSGIGDLNGDLRDDLVLRNGSGDIVLWFMNGGAVTGASLGNVSTAWQIEVLGDFNGDGRDDFIWRNGTTGDMSMWLMNGTAVTPNSFANVGGAWTIAGVGDLNGDGRDDVVWRNGTTGDTSLWFMNSGSIASSSGFNVAANFTISDVADFNGDGRDDLIWRNTSTNDVLAWYMNGGVVQGSAYLGNLGADWLINPGG